MEINNDYITFLIKLQYKTKPGEEIFIYGDNKDFGNWTSPKFKLNWSEGHIWQADYKIPKTITYIKYKFVCHSKDNNLWEEGDNRLLSPQNIEYLPKTDDGKYILNCVWGYFQLNFNIHYIVKNSTSNMRIVGGIDALTNWKKPIRLHYDEKKVITAKDGNQIEGFWTTTFLINNKYKKNFNFEYRYSILDDSTKTAVWEREPNRCLHILTELNDDNSLNIKNNPDEYKLLTNSYLQILDVNFVADFIFNKMGEKNIFIGPYPQNKDDLISLSKSNINSILNVQSDGDLKYRQINLELLKAQSRELGIELIHYPINDFDSNDLLNKLKGAGDLLNDLLKNGKTVYVHCTAGMSRAAATVIIYLVLYEDFTVETAKNFCKKYRPVICPNYDVINKIAKIFKPGSEMLDKINSNTNINEAWKKLREINGSPIKGNNMNDKDDEYRLLKYNSSGKNPKIKKSKSRKKIKRPKSILKQHSYRKESSQELRYKSGLTRSITFILDNDWDKRIKRKESEKLRTRSKLNLEKKEMDHIKKNLMLDLQKKNIGITNTNNKNNNDGNNHKFKKNKIKKDGENNIPKYKSNNNNNVKNKEIIKKEKVKEKKVVNNSSINKTSYSCDKNYKIQNKINTKVNNTKSGGQKTSVNNVKTNNNIKIKNNKIVKNKKNPKEEKIKTFNSDNNTIIVKERIIEKKDEKRKPKKDEKKVEKKEENKEIKKVRKKDIKKDEKKI